MTQIPSDLLPFYDQIHRYAFRVTGSRDEADDVTQEVFLRYLGSGKSYHGDQLRNYLYRTARNYMIDQHRRRTLHAKLTSDENSESSLAYRSLFTPPASPDQSVQTSELQAIVRQQVNRLSPQKQEILHLRYDEQMKAKDIAEVVGLSYGNVRRILSETIAFLSKELEAYK